METAGLRDAMQLNASRRSTFIWSIVYITTHHIYIYM